MRGAADAEKGPPFRDGTVVEHLRVTRDVSVIRLQLDDPLYFHPGQYVTVQVPQWPRRWRYLSPSIPADRGGAIEFHVRSVHGRHGQPAIVGETTTGDRWRLSNPHGAMHVDRERRRRADGRWRHRSGAAAGDRSWTSCRFGVNPRVHLFFGGRYPCDLYDLKTLWQVASTNPWLSVTPVSEYSTNPPWAADYPDVEPPRGLHVRQTGTLPDVVTRYGGWGDRQILVCGGPADGGGDDGGAGRQGRGPADGIQHDPLARVSRDRIGNTCAEFEMPSR